jgi:transposase
MTKRKNHSPEFKARVALDAIREEMALAELPKKYDVHPTQNGTWKRAAIENMATAFTRRGSAPEQVNAAELDKLHSKIGQLVVERDFLADASHQLLGTRGKNGEQRSQAERLVPMRAAKTYAVQR